MRSSYKGKYKPRHPEKYKGDPTNVVFRSLLERSFMIYLDNNKSILEWQSEEFFIEYMSPLDKAKHRYFPDFFIKALDSKGNIKTILIEIKPESQTVEPEVKQKKTKNYLLEVTAWITNCAKWNAAKNWCKKNNAEFRILTEKDIKPRHKYKYARKSNPTTKA